jgi:hypothetical protein
MRVFRSREIMLLEVGRLVWVLKVLVEAVRILVEVVGGSTEALRFLERLRMSIKAWVIVRKVEAMTVPDDAMQVPIEIVRVPLKNVRVL